MKTIDKSVRSAFEQLKEGNSAPGFNFVSAAIEANSTVLVSINGSQSAQVRLSPWQAVSLARNLLEVAGQINYQEKHKETEN